MRVLRGRITSGVGDASNWPIDQVREVTGYHDLVPGTLNVVLEEPHRLRPDFTLYRECRTDARPEDLHFECCSLLIGADKVRALVARTSTNFHGSAVLEVMAGVNLKDRYGLRDGDWMRVEVCADGGPIGLGHLA